MWESEFLIFLCITGEETKPKEEEWCWTNLKVAVVAGVTAVVAVPLLLSGAGFTTVGVAAGSVAAFVQSFFYGGVVGSTSIFATLQSAGALGIGWLAKLSIFATFTATTNYIMEKLSPCNDQPKCSSDKN